MNDFLKFRTCPQGAFNFNELLVDSFAGGGGASTGIEQALGRSVDIAINHDIDAIKMHEINHPTTKHFCESVWDVDPIEVCNGQPVGLAWFSPDCKHFSKAKGGKPVEKKIRGLAWIAMRWAALVKPRIIMLENVEEFKTWGPIIDGKPCKKRKGQTFDSFIRQLREHGYQVEHKELKACDYGAPTIRKRFFLIARCDGEQINWPTPTHGDPSSKEVKTGLLKPWRTAASIIDWSLPCPSIFERKKPLAENALKRIAKGIQRYVIDSDEPFIVQSQTAVPFITEFANASNQRNMSANEPLRTQCAQVKGGHFGLVCAFLSKYYTGVVGADIKEPLPTVTAVDHNAVVTSHMIKFRGGNVGHGTNEPLHTISAGGTHLGEVRSFLLKYYGTDTGQSTNNPLHTVTARDRFGLVTIKGEDYQIVDIGLRMLQPHELYAAQDFPDDYIINVDAEGNKVTKKVQVARCGNAVCPSVARALVEANYSVDYEAKKAA